LRTGRSAAGGCEVAGAGQYLGGTYSMKSGEEKMRKLFIYGVAICLGLLAWDKPAGADVVIYRQNFSASAGMTNLSAVNWNAYYGNSSTVATTAPPGSTGSPPNAMISAGPSGPSAGANVNAKQISGVTTDVNGLVPLLSINGVQQMVAYTNEYTIDQTQDTPTAFAWYAASGYTGDLQRLMIQIGGNWYASTSPVSPPGGVIQGTSFAGGSQQFTTTFSTSASAWDTLNFSPGSDLTLGSVLSSPLPAGNITGFGIYAQIADNSGATVTNERTFFDTFEADATPLPEPATSGLIGLIGMPVLLRRRGRN
jgi:hypothetical protein